jgi:hypothetical protein
MTHIARSVITSDIGAEAMIVLRTLGDDARPFVGHEVRQVLQAGREPVVSLARLKAGDPDRAHCGAILDLDRGGGEKSQVRRPRDHRLVSEARVDAAVRDPDGFALGDRQPDSRHVFVFVAVAVPDLAAVDQGDAGAGDPEQGLRQTRRALKDGSGLLQTLGCLRRTPRLRALCAGHASPQGILFFLRSTIAEGR